MKLSDALNSYYELSGTGSSVARQLAFAGIALIWVFRSSNEGSVLLPAPLWLPTILLVSGLALDMLQYLFGAVVWGTFHRVNEKRYPNEPDREVEAPAWLNWPALIAFWGKTSCVAIAHLLLLRFTIHGVSFGA